MLRPASRAALAVSAVGALVSAYLTWVHYAAIVPVCLGGGGCETVQGSSYATVQDVPVALLGLAFFASAAAIVVLGGGTARARLALFGLTLAGAIFAGYLGALELFVIHAICQWCVVVALCVVSLLVIAARGLGSE